jgi:hypothetical protein
VPDGFVQLALAGDLDQAETEDLRNAAHGISGVGKRALDAKLKSARGEHTKRQSEDRRNQRAADRCDPRPPISVPANDEPWLPQMQVINEVLGHAVEAEPPARDIDGFCTRLQMQAIPLLHLLSTEFTNPESGE